jgi:hypothetical protein
MILTIVLRLFTYLAPKSIEIIWLSLTLGRGAERDTTYGTNVDEQTWWNKYGQ